MTNPSSNETASCQVEAGVLLDELDDDEPEEDEDELDDEPPDEELDELDDESPLLPEDSDFADDFDLSDPDFSEPDESDEDLSFEPLPDPLRLSLR